MGSYCVSIVQYYAPVLLLLGQLLGNIFWRSCMNLSGCLLRSSIGKMSLTLDGHDGDDPKQSTADMTVFVQNLLQQMQSRFKAMSESIITKNILLTCFMMMCLLYLVNEMQIRKSGLDEMGSRIDELEQSINELRAEMGAEGPSPSTPDTKVEDA
ncbi:hypothetical protein Dimus_019021 [Dionaea muscipula]